MSQNTKNYQSELLTDHGFLEELEAVEDKLALAFDGLYAPLAGLVRAQIRQAKPHLRAAVVLATAVKDEESPQLKEKRIFLAAALEMLYIALNIHQVLYSEAEEVEDTIDKSILGSTILAGDYCFSHAASLAVRTDSPEVVAIFSQTLQSISEDQLRTLFDAAKGDGSAVTPKKQDFDASAELFRAGIRSANVLVPFSPATLAACEKAISVLIAQLLSRDTLFSAHTSGLAEIQAQRWLNLVQWLNESSSMHQSDS